jgi:hypothetical protein
MILPVKRKSSCELDTYIRHIVHSWPEFTVAKDQNVGFRSGWFSERSGTCLAAGKPVITQDTGFSNVLPTGYGLFAFSTLEEILRAIGQINGSYEHHCRRALALAHELFDYRVVLKRLLNEVRA